MVQPPAYSQALSQRQRYQEAEFTSIEFWVEDMVIFEIQRTKLGYERSALQRAAEGGQGGWAKEAVQHNPENRGDTAHRSGLT